MKNFLYTIVGIFLLKLNAVNAIDYGSSKVNDDLKGSTDGADSAIQVLIKNAMLFLYLVAVVYGLWGGFQILTAGGKDDQVKKGRTIIVQALMGLVVIWLASSIVQFVIESILGGGATTS
ncbi:MAG: hypothetical protein PHN31_06450 [Candidatus Gracilibacteria bacterium]|nr:hypothetical protein [Candidatus Gracilibacteria bacterium]